MLKVRPKDTVRLGSDGSSMVGIWGSVNDGNGMEMEGSLRLITNPKETVILGSDGSSMVGI